MGLMQKILGAGDPATSRRTQSDPRMKGAGRGRTTRATRGKTPPGSLRFGMNKSKPTGRGRGRGRGKSSSGGLSRLLGSLTGRR
jgi:hypothetical protein